MSETTAEERAYLKQSTDKVVLDLLADLEAAEECAQKAEARVRELEGLRFVHEKAARAYAERVLLAARDAGLEACKAMLRRRDVKLGDWYAEHYTALAMEALADRIAAGEEP